MQPRQIRETFKPVEPRLVYSICAFRVLDFFYFTQDAVIQRFDSCFFSAVASRSPLSQSPVPEEAWSRWSVRCRERSPEFRRLRLPAVTLLRLPGAPATQDWDQRAPEFPCFESRP